MSDEEKSLVDEKEKNSLPDQSEDKAIGEKYEITFIVDEKSTNETVKSAIEATGAKIVSETEVGVRKFIYPIGKKTSGKYFAIEFQASPEMLVKLEKQLKTIKELIRYLIIKALRKPLVIKRENRDANGVEIIKTEDKKPPSAGTTGGKPEIRNPVPTGRQAKSEKSSNDENLKETTTTEPEEVTLEEVIENKPEELDQEEIKQEQKAEGEEQKVEDIKLETSQPATKKPVTSKPAPKKKHIKAEKMSAEELDSKLAELVSED